MKDLKTNLKKRVIPIILFSNYQVVKSKEFKDFRIFGNLEQTINVFNNRNVDEIIVLDIDASKKKTKINLDVLKILSRNTLMPFSYGGGIQTIDDIQQCLIYGCDKVIINTKCLQKIEFIKEASRSFGSQCIVASVDYKVTNENKYEIFSHAGSQINNLDINKYIKDLEKFGAGEIMLTSVNHEGKLKGYEKGLLEKVSREINIPILINGGCGIPEHMVEPLLLGADGVCAGSIFYFTQYAYKDIKNILQKNKIKVRSI